MDILITEQQIQNKVIEIAKKITKDYEGKEITLICILKGSTFFTVDLAKRIDNPLKIEFIQVSSYNDSTESSGNIVMKLDLKESIEGKDIIVIEDIIDTRKNTKLFNKISKRKKSC